jgi:hypothetical protein
MELKARNGAGRSIVGTAWHSVADEHLAAARDAACHRRVDDAWDFLHSAQRQALNALTQPEIEGVVAGLDRECSSKLVGWRKDAAAANIAEVRRALAAMTAHEKEPWGTDVADARPRRVPAAAYAALINARRILDENSYNTYLRLRLVGERLLLATSLMAALLVGLGGLVAADLLRSSFSDVTVLHDLGTYSVIALLGVLGALLSFSIGTLRSGGNRRIYELATGRYAATIARVLVGAAAAIVVAIAIQSGVVTLDPDWLLMLAIAAGFSERLVRRIVESFSADAERPREPAPPSVANRIADSAG